jgi:hypothetical protein
MSAKQWEGKFTQDAQSYATPPPFVLGSNELEKTKVLYYKTMRFEQFL